MFFPGIEQGKQIIGCDSLGPDLPPDIWSHTSRVARRTEGTGRPYFHEQGPFGLNQFTQFWELARSTYGWTSLATQFWQMISALYQNLSGRIASALQNWALFLTKLPLRFSDERFQCAWSVLSIRQHWCWSEKWSAPFCNALNFMRRLFESLTAILRF